ncbi:MAG: hypothetical protein ACOYK8_01205 [Alphaproteobacteria bacterium]
MLNADEIWAKGSTSSGRSSAPSSAKSAPSSKNSNRAGGRISGNKFKKSADLKSKIPTTQKIDKNGKLVDQATPNSNDKSFFFGSNNPASSTQNKTTVIFPPYLTGGVPTRYNYSTTTTPSPSSVESLTDRAPVDNTTGSYDNSGEEEEQQQPRAVCDNVAYGSVVWSEIPDEFRHGQDFHKTGELRDNNGKTAFIKFSAIPKNCEEAGTQTLWVSSTFNDAAFTKPGMCDKYQKEMKLGKQPNPENSRQLFNAVECVDKLEFELTDAEKNQKAWDSAIPWLVVGGVAGGLFVMNRLRRRY